MRARAHEQAVRDLLEFRKRYPLGAAARSHVDRRGPQALMRYVLDASTALRFVLDDERDETVDR